MKNDPWEGMTVEERLAAMPPFKKDAERIRELGYECPKTATEAQALLKQIEAFPKAQVGAGMTLDRQRKVVSEAQRKLIEEEKRWAEAKKHNQVWLNEMKQMGEHHARMKRVALEAEYWAKEQRRMNGLDYNPIKLFQNEIEKEIG